MRASYSKYGLAFKTDVARQRFVRLLRRLSVETGLDRPTAATRAVQLALRAHGVESPSKQRSQRSRVRARG